MRQSPPRFSTMLHTSALTLVAALHLVTARPVLAQPSSDSYDPWGNSSAAQDSDTSGRSPEELTSDAIELMDNSGDRRPLDARSKLLAAIQKSPGYYPAFQALSSYYMIEVGHFRLALKYCKTALRLFLEQKGPPPYQNRQDQRDHAMLLYLLSQARLNLDDYPGSLEALEQYRSYGYFSSWFAGSKAWVLMKLGRLTEAIKEARLGVLVGGEPGRTLNMLGILLSMNGEPEAAIQSLREALTVELSAGEQGQPATPLNNMGEVFRELFQDDKAEAAWIKSHTYPDGCEHVLPSLNLSLLYLEEAKYAEAKEAMDWFQSCVQKYSLKNDEEHRALVNLARGRVALLTGSPLKALDNFQLSLQSTQWFGKIGTNQDDLILGGTISAAQAYRAAANRLYFTAATSWRAVVENRIEELSLRLKSWWSFRKAAIMASERLNNLEDLEIHHTDSLIEYATFGETLAEISVPAFKRRLEQELGTDRRPAAKPYYLAYEAENLKAHGERSRSLGMFKEALKLCRPVLDARLRAHILANLATYYSKSSAEYLALTRELFSIARPLIKNYGLALPINIVQTRPSVLSALEKVGFFVLSSERSPFVIQASELPNNELKLEFQSSEFGVQQIVSTGSAIPELVNGLSDAVFSQQIQ